MNLYASMASMGSGTDAGTGAAAAYARAAAHCTEERERLQRAGARPAQVRALGAMADLFHTLAEARRARDEAERRLNEGPLESLEDILAAPRAAAAALPGPGSRPSS